MLTETTSEGPKRRFGWGRRGTAGAAIAARLSFERVSHRYEGTLAVDGFSADIEPAEIVCLLGPSGCGKSTLLKLAAGLEVPMSGRILVNNREVSGPDRILPPEKRGMGLMFQDFALFPHLNILHNVMFGLTTLDRKSAAQAARTALRRVGLEDYAGLYPHLLSGGEQQRVALARAIAPRPSVLLMDEPFSGLDSRLRDEVRDETLAVLRETRATCIIVTHDPEEAMRMADRILLMRNGRLIQSGSAAELYHQPADLAAARFFSELNIFSGIVEDGMVATPIGSFPAEGSEAGTGMAIGVRPHGIRIVPAGEGVPGRLLARRFLGEIELLELAVDGLDRPLTARAPARAISEPEGAEIGIAVDEETVLLFPTAEAPQANLT